MEITCERCRKELEAEPLEVPMCGVICDECVEKEERKKNQEGSKLSVRGMGGILA